jgi:tagatose 1,6-diphosphate aldolase
VGRLFASLRESEALIKTSDLVVEAEDVLLGGFVDGVPAYRFDMAVGARVVGQIELRLGADSAMVNFGGQIGFGVEPPHRGRHYAARRLRLLLPLARAHGMTELWVTCNPENAASRRTCELAGAELVDVVDIPHDSDMYLEGERQKCRYRLATG